MVNSPGPKEEKHILGIVVTLRTRANRLILIW